MEAVFAYVAGGLTTLGVWVAIELMAIRKHRKNLEIERTMLALSDGAQARLKQKPEVQWNQGYTIPAIPQPYHITYGGQTYAGDSTNIATPFNQQLSSGGT